MKENNVHAIYFSPALSTKKIVLAVSKGISESVLRYDITQGIKRMPTFAEGDVAVIGVPAYYGRVPALAKTYLSQFKANNTPLILVCVYGNREFEDTLLELKTICTACGFRVISAGAFIARHSIFTNVAGDRPDTADLKMAEAFGNESLERMGEGEMALPGNDPYRAMGAIPFVPKGGSRCDRCGICVKSCPTHAIGEDNPKKTDKSKCISCGRCIELCPKKTRKY